MQTPAHGFYTASSYAPGPTCHETSTVDAEEHGLIRRVAAHDPRAFETLYQRYAPRLAAYLRPRLGQPALVDDVCQDVMLVIWQQAARFQPRARLSTWIFGIAWRKALKARLQRARHLAGPPEAAAEEQVPEDPERHLSQQEQARAVAHALAALPPDLQAVVEGRYYQAQSYAELAARLGCSVPTVKHRMHQAHRRLALYLRPRDRDQPGYPPRASSSVLASWRSTVSKPSVNQP